MYWVYILHESLKVVGPPEGISRVFHSKQNSTEFRTLLGLLFAVFFWEKGCSHERMRYWEYRLFKKASFVTELCRHVSSIV